MRFHRRAACAVTLAGLAAAPLAWAGPAGLAVSHAWSRPAAAGANGVGYMTLVNRGAADRLVGADSPLAARVELHSASMAGGVMRMAAEREVAVPAGGKVSFAPGGLHLMFVGLKRPLHLGDRLPATLRFASGARLKASFAVTAAPPAEGATAGMAGMR